MTIEQDVLKPQTPGEVKLFELDLSSIPGTNLPEPLRFTNHNSATPIMFGGNIYTQRPIQIEGLDESVGGAVTRPTLTIGALDENRAIAILAATYSDLVGAKLRYIPTFDTYLNSPSAISRPVLTMILARKLSQTYSQLSYELRFALDNGQLQLPNIQMTRESFPGLGVNGRLFLS